LNAALLRWVHDLSVQGIILTDEQLLVRFCNGWLEKQIGTKESDLIGRHLFDIFPELKTRGVDRYYFEAINGQSRVLSHRLHKYLLPMAPSSGVGTFAQMQQSARISPLYEEDRIVGTITVIDDVTERVIREMELNAQLEERGRLLSSELAARELAEANSRIKDEFLATVSHEIRAPLNAITGWTQLLLNGQLDEARSHHALDTIQRNVKSQAQIIEDLLDISRIVAGQMRLDLQPLNLTESIEAAIESVSPAAVAKNIQLIQSAPSQPVFIMGDGGRLQQILWNLLANAVKFTPGGGMVETALREIDGFAELTVRDNGQGIRADFLPFVFDRFRQAEGGSKRKAGGLGLGLSIVRNLVEMHGGVIAVESRGEGSGTVFTISLPLLIAEKDRSGSGRMGKRTDDSDAHDISGCRILIVEDDKDSREMLGILLEAFNAETMMAATATEALGQMPRFKPDILISDLGMPEIDGYDLIKQIRTLTPDQGGRVPAIALTGFAGAEEMKRVHSAGFDMHLSKPIDQDKLIKAVNQLRHKNL